VHNLGVLFVTLTFHLPVSSVAIPPHSSGASRYRTFPQLNLHRPASAARARERFQEILRVVLVQRANCVDGFLLRRSVKSRGNDGIPATANRIVLSGGRAEIAALADRAGLSLRQFERRFMRQVGIRPKLFRKDCKVRSGS